MVSSNQWVSYNLLINGVFLGSKITHWSYLPGTSKCEYMGGCVVSLVLFVVKIPTRPQKNGRERFVVGFCLRQCTRKWSSIWLKVTFLSPGWRSLILWKGSIKHPKRSPAELPGTDFLLLFVCSIFNLFCGFALLRWSGLHVAFFCNITSHLTVWKTPNDFWDVRVLIRPKGQWRGPWWTHRIHIIQVYLPTNWP